MIAINGPNWAKDAHSQQLSDRAGRRRPIQAQGRPNAQITRTDTDASERPTRERTPGLGKQWERLAGWEDRSNQSWETRHSACPDGVHGTRRAGQRTRRQWNGPTNWPEPIRESGRASVPAVARPLQMMAAYTPLCDFLVGTPVDTGHLLGIAPAQSIQDGAVALQHRFLVCAVHRVVEIAE